MPDMRSEQEDSKSKICSNDFCKRFPGKFKISPFFMFRHCPTLSDVCESRLTKLRYIIYRKPLMDSFYIAKKRSSSIILRTLLFNLFKAQFEMSIKHIFVGRFAHWILLTQFI